MKAALRFLIVSLLIAITMACERDDICVDEITPKLIIRFYDKDNPVLFKDVIDLQVHIEGVEEPYVNETITSLTDSIALPIGVANDRTRYILTLLENEVLEREENADTIEISYVQEDEFVGRSCGYRALFYEVGGGLIPDDDNWIYEILPTKENQDIIDESAAHVKIYH